MEWIRTHPYASALAAAACFIIAIAFVVESRSPLPLSQSTVTWSGGTPVSAYQSGSVGQTSPQQIAQEVIQNGAQATLTLPPLATSTYSSFEPTSSSFNYVALLAQLSGNATVSAPAAGGNATNSAIVQAYQFIPAGLIATTAPARKPMTAAQQAIYDYGNEVGGEIQSFENLHTNEARILKDQAEDRSDPTKAAALVSLGQGFASVGTFLQGIQDVPTSAASLHSALAQSYLDIGAKLQLVGQAQGDAAFVQAVENYDAAANTFVHNYGALAQFFTEHGVVFQPQDGGSVFSFSNTGGSL